MISEQAVEQWRKVPVAKAPDSLKLNALDFEQAGDCP
jgi:hypothetical protein